MSITSISSRRIMIAACIFIAVGYLLMSGPGSTEEAFNPDIFSVRRIVIAPILCLSGYLLIILGILCLRTPSDEATDEETKD